MNYISKIWLLTIFVTPFIYWPINVYVNDHSLFNLNEIAPVAFATMLGACILSLPTFLILYLCLDKMKKKDYKEKYIKRITSIIGSIGVICTFALLDSSILFSFIGLLFPASYILLICFSSYYFKTDKIQGESNCS